MSHIAVTSMTYSCYGYPTWTYPILKESFLCFSRLQIPVTPDVEKVSNDAPSLAYTTQRSPQHPKHCGDFARQVTLKGSVKPAAIQPFILIATMSSPAQVKVVQQDTKTTKKRIDVGPMDLQNLNISKHHWVQIGFYTVLSVGW